MWQKLTEQLLTGDRRALARSISLVENEAPGYLHFLQQLPLTHQPPVIGITGPPGAGKSTLTDALIHELIKDGKSAGILCVDPSSPFHHGALLGDRVRMSRWYLHPQVFIRSLASRGAMGGLNPKIIEITDLLKAAAFDYIIIETVGVGQSEIEIARLADVTTVVLVPEAGDEIQTMKAGLMEIADVFVVNKADRPDASQFIKNLRLMLAPAFSRTRTEIPIIPTVATNETGVAELAAAILQSHTHSEKSGKRQHLLAEKAYQLIQAGRMRDISLEKLREELAQSGERNIYRFVEKYAGSMDGRS